MSVISSLPFQSLITFSPFALDGQDILQPLFAEEKLSFAACGSTYVTLTITRIRRVYNPTDAALICKVVSTSLVTVIKIVL